MPIAPLKSMTISAPLSSEEFERQREETRKLGLPGVSGTAQHSRLAIVGSGLSIEEALEELRGWDGEIWAINGAWRWLSDRGVDAAFFSIDPTESIIPLAEGALRMVVHVQLRREVFQSALARGADVKVFDPHHHVGGYSAIGAAFAGIEAGYTEISFFGCECSHEPERVHIHNALTPDPPLVISVLGQDFFARAVYYHQCLELSQIIREAPGLFKERSGGMLRAMVELPKDSGIAAG